MLRGTRSQVTLLIWGSGMDNLSVGALLEEAVVPMGGGAVHSFKVYH